MRSYAIADGHHTAAPIASLTTTYEYTGYERTRESVTAGDTLQQRRTYHYDPFGRMHQLDELEGTATRTTNILYDANGNMLSRSDADDASASEYFDYDPWDHMTAMHEGAAAAPPVARYEYDPSGMRIRELGTSRGDVEAFYADGALLEERTPLGALVSHYHEGPLGTLRFDGGDGEVSYFHMDASGSTMALTGAAGATNQTTTLDPWGAVESQTGTSGNRELFTGHRTDTETGLVYMGARYYDPALGQFTTADSYLGEPSEPGSMQRYMYANANPGRYWDPDGHSAAAIATHASRNWGEHAAVDGGDSNAVAQPLLTEREVGVDVTAQRRGLTAAITHQAVSDARALAPAILDQVQDVLSVVGLIPGLGEPFDFLSSMISLARGNYLDAGLGIISMIPFVGWLGGGGRLLMRSSVGRFIARHADEAYQFVRPYTDEIVAGVRRYGEEGMTYARNMAERGITAASNAIERGWTYGRQAAPAAVSRVDEAVQGGRQFIGRNLEEALSGACAVATALCFVAGTLVTTVSSGQQPIESLRVGDRVHAADESHCAATESQDYVRVAFHYEREPGDVQHIEVLTPRSDADAYVPGTDAWVEHREFGVRAWVTIDSVEEADIEEGEGCLVLSTVRHTTRGLVRLRLGDASDVVVTATHRFWSSTRHAWVSVGALVMGEQVSTEGGTQRVASVVALGGAEEVFNLEVEGVHEYLAGEAGIRVHNGNDRNCLQDEIEQIVGDAASTARHGDYHGPYRPLPAGDFNWRKYITDMTGATAPRGMYNPHGHHILLKEGRRGRVRTLVDEGHAILQRRAGIDPIWDMENLVFAPNGLGNHELARVEMLVGALRRVDDANGTREHFVRVLDAFGRFAASRTP